MPTKIGSRLFFDGLSQKASALLEKYYVPAQRYGTAFHITPPFTDVREIPSIFSIQKQSKLPLFENLSEYQQQAILETLSSHDPYLLWMVVHATQVPVHVLTVSAGQQMGMTLLGPELLWIFLEPGSQLTLEQFITDQELGMNRVFIWGQADSRMTYWGLRSSNSFLTDHIHVELQGSRASAHVRHLTFGSGKEQADMNVAMYHRAASTESNLMVRTAASDKHMSIYRGLIDIDEKAKGSKGYQSGQALLLSRKAVVDNLPELAIRTNDVQCSHGVNTTHIDDAALFYMRSRGLSRSVAWQLALTGFYHDKMEIPHSLASALASVIDNQVPATDV